MCKINRNVWGQTLWDECINDSHLWDITLIFIYSTSYRKPLFFSLLLPLVCPAPMPPLKNLHTKIIDVEYLGIYSYLEWEDTFKYEHE